MDRYKIVFVCKEAPRQDEGLKGFKTGEYYEGRSYNGLFEVSPKWGSNDESKLISHTLFNKYFELMTEHELIKTPA